MTCIGKVGELFLHRTTTNTFLFFFNLCPVGLKYSCMVCCFAAVVLCADLSLYFRIFSPCMCIRSIGPWCYEKFLCSD
jgi:hypothetical protein